MNNEPKTIIFRTKLSRPSKADIEAGIYNRRGLDEARTMEVVRLYSEEFFTLAMIGTRYQLTRERVRQLISLVLSKEEIRAVKQAKKIKNIKIKYGSYENYQAELAKKKAMADRMANGAWSRHYDACLGCGRTDRPHKYNGRCSPCATKYTYHNVPHRREQIKQQGKRWREKNKEHYLEVQRKYQKEYFRRPEVKERLTKYRLEYEKRPEVKERLRAYYKKNKKKFAAQQKARELANPEKYKAMRMAYRLRHKDAMEAYRKAYYLKNKDKIIARQRVYNKRYHNKKRAQLINAT